MRLATRRPGCGHCGSFEWSTVPNTLPKTMCWKPPGQWLGTSLSGVRVQAARSLSLGGAGAVDVGVVEDEDEALDVYILRDDVKPSPEEVLEERSNLWKAAIKLPMYWVALIPVMVGACLVVYEQSFVNIRQLSCLFLAALMIIAWLNLSNDVYDAKTGADVEKKESVVNLTGKREPILWLSLAFLIVGVATLAHALAGPNHLMALYMLASAIGCGYVYQGPPFRLSYKGLGEPLCFAAFGPLATTAFYLALCDGHVGLSSIPALVWVCSTMVGLTTALILFCSHFHQYDGDKAAGKLSPVVQLGGIELSVKVLKYASWMPFLILGSATVAGVLPVATLFLTGILAIPKAMQLNDFAAKNQTNLEVIKRLKLVAIQLHKTFGMALGTSLLAATLF